MRPCLNHKTLAHPLEGHFGSPPGLCGSSDQTQGAGEPVLAPEGMLRAVTWAMRPVGVKSLSFLHWESDFTQIYTDFTLSVLHRQIVIGQRAMAVN